MKDLVVLAADKNIEHALMGLFERTEAMGIRPITVDIQVHPQRDPACALHGVEFLSGSSERYAYALLVFDHEGSGFDDTTPHQLQESLNEEFTRSRWGDRAKALVLVPELEAWVWSDSPHVEEVAGWRDRNPPLRNWLTDRGFLAVGEVKPLRPKEAFEAALYESRIPRSSSLYLQLAQRVSLERCTDTAFIDFKAILQGWFPMG